jgi:hypothetical protein
MQKVKEICKRHLVVATYVLISLSPVAKMGKQWLILV